MRGGSGGDIVQEWMWNLLTHFKDFMTQPQVVAQTISTASLSLLFVIKERLNCYVNKNNGMNAHISLIYASFVIEMKWHKNV